MLRKNYYRYFYILLSLALSGINSQIIYAKGKKTSIDENAVNIQKKDILETSNFNTQEYSENKENLQNFVQSLINFAIQILNGKESDEIKKQKVEELLSNSLDIPKISTMILGKFNSQLHKDKKLEFQNIFKKYLLGFYGSVVKLYRGQVGKIAKISYDPEQNLYIVHVDIVNRDGNNLQVQYVITYKDSKFVILDAVSQNISFVITLKTQFKQILSEENGFEKLKDFLKTSDPNKLKNC